jgi:hypothetical protein
MSHDARDVQSKSLDRSSDSVGSRMKICVKQELILIAAINGLRGKGNLAGDAGSAR